MCVISVCYFCVCVCVRYDMYNMYIIYIYMPVSYHYIPYICLDRAQLYTNHWPFWVEIRSRMKKGAVLSMGRCRDHTRNVQIMNRKCVCVYIYIILYIYIYVSTVLCI